MAAEHLARGGAAVTLYERMPSVGRKLLLAGRGGLNITHGEDFTRFLERFGQAAPALLGALQRFTPGDLRDWAESLGQPTFVGSSGRVFPRDWKASPLLRAWLVRLGQLGVRFALRHRWIGFDAAADPAFLTPDGQMVVHHGGAVLLALGGASWPRLGSDGSWAPVLGRAGVAVRPLRAANCGLLVPWSATFSSRFAGTPLKRIGLSFGAKRILGETVVTAPGLEGGAVYALASDIRDELDRTGRAILGIDLKPDVGAKALAVLLGGERRKQSASTYLRKAIGLPPVAIALLRESTRGPLPADPAALAALVKGVAIRVSGVAAIDRAISSAGGVAFDEIDDAFMLRRLPGIFVAGEMLDWDAPTGGYLLSASMATGAAAARGALAWLRSDREIDAEEAISGTSAWR